MTAGSRHWAVALFIALTFVVAVHGGPRKTASSRDTNRLKSETARTITGPDGQIQQAVAGGAGMIFRLTPRKDYPGGSYNSSIYTQADISGQTLTLSGAPGRVFIELQLSDWDPDGSGPFLRIWETYVDAMSYTSGTGTALVEAMEACASTAECNADFGTSGSFCSSGFCTYAWIKKSRPDGIQLAAPVAPCSNNIWDVGNFLNPAGHNYFGVLDQYEPGADQHCGLTDPGTIQYAGSFALDVQAGAVGTYTITLQPAVTVAQDDSAPDGFDIPIAALLPAIINIPCTVNAQCDDGNACTSDVCDSGVCAHSPRLPGTSCGSANTSGCDAQDTCNGAGLCVARVKPSGTVCRTGSGGCDIPEVCNGISAACPADVVIPDGAVCPNEGDFCTDDWCVAGVCVHIDDCSCTTVEAVCGDGCCMVGDEQVATCPADCQDLRDMADLLTCVRINSHPPLSPCLDFDVDGDAKITLLDYRVYTKRYFGGP